MLESHDLALSKPALDNLQEAESLDVSSSNEIASAKNVEEECSLRNEDTDKMKDNESVDKECDEAVRVVPETYNNNISGQEIAYISAQHVKDLNNNTTKSSENADDTKVFFYFRRFNIKEFLVL